MILTRTWLAAFAGAICLAPLQAVAQETDSNDDIIVTAQKREQNVQDVPIAVSVLNADTLADNHVTDVMDLNALAPGLQIKTDDNAANPKIFIRGIGLNDFNPNTAGAVALYSDGVYIGSPLAQMSQFFDLDRVEVLRGPQGTLYGRNTTGGAINLISRRPTQSWEGDANFEAGEFGSMSIDGGVGGPLVDNLLAFRVAAIYTVDDGYTTNRLTGHEGNNADRGSVRASLLWTPANNFEALFQARYARSQGGSIWAYNRSLLPATPEATGPDGFCAPGFYTSGQCTDLGGYANTSSDLYAGDYHLEGQDEVETYGGSAILTWDLGAVSLISVTGYDHAARDDVEDTDAGPTDIITARYRAQQWAASEELRLQSNGDGPATWVLGVYFAHDDLSTNSYYDVFRVANTGDPLDAPVLAGLGIGVFAWPFSQETDSYAAFGQLDYALTDRLTATIGLRYSSDEKTFDYQSLYSVQPDTAPDLPAFIDLHDNDTFSSVSGRLGLQYALSDDINLYASYNRGYKSGGFFGGQTVDPATVVPYDDEVVNAYEIGVKTELFDRRLRANFAAFHYDYQDLQVYTLVVSPDPPFLTIQQFTNASNATVSGVEAELSASPAEGLDLSLTAAYLEATYEDFSSEGDDYSGNTLPNAPELSLTASAQYEWPAFGGRARAQGDVSYRSKVFYDTRNVERLSDPERTFVNARLGWTTPDEHLEVGIFGRNLFDETNISDIIPIEGLGFDLFSMGAPPSAGVFARFNY
jgi:iron complex outermembrane receptor protein